MFVKNMISHNGKRCNNCKHNITCRTSNGREIHICNIDNADINPVQNAYHTCDRWKKSKR